MITGGEASANPTAFPPSAPPANKPRATVATKSNMPI